MISLWFFPTPRYYNNHKTILNTVTYYCRMLALPREEKSQYSVAYTVAVHCDWQVWRWRLTELLFRICWDIPQIAGHRQVCATVYIPSLGSYHLSYAEVMESPLALWRQNKLCHLERLIPVQMTMIASSLISLLMKGAEGLILPMSSIIQQNIYICHFHLFVKQIVEL